MKHKIYTLFFLILLSISCKNDNEKRVENSKKDIQKKELIFSKIEKGWVFNTTPINQTSQTITATWNEWRLFLTELSQKPKKTIGAFQQKAKALSTKAMALNDKIPPQFDKPQIKSRISTLITKVRMLDLFIHLDNIPDKKVILLVAEINTELVALQTQMDRIVIKSKIPLEEGESEIRKMLDTTRAIPNVKPATNLPSIE